MIFMLLALYLDVFSRQCIEETWILFHMNLEFLIEVFSGVWDVFDLVERLDSELARLRGLLEHQQHELDHQMQHLVLQQRLQRELEEELKQQQRRKRRRSGELARERSRQNPDRGWFQGNGWSPRKRWRGNVEMEEVEVKQEGKSDKCPDIYYFGCFRMFCNCNGNGSGYGGVYRSVCGYGSGSGSGRGNGDSSGYDSAYGCGSRSGSGDSSGYDYGIVNGKGKTDKWTFSNGNGSGSDHGNGSSYNNGVGYTNGIGNGFDDDEPEENIFDVRGFI
ncbi:unnamed protein product [Didymodactylos carnosus]|uniref:Uncharacterized protein n=1 Tax=Didymodactylos carnosus TaxID=1234261 RepID=A0A8S2DC18_9BILA|nr:unnamed protein product [Didymodactylos carnosus]CAF3640234.1 unnamed protein product [Didymodactylos carnosus]